LRQRPFYRAKVERALAHNPVCAILGPRQCGKTTLARELARRAGKAHYFDLETPQARTRLAQPDLTLAPLQGLVVIDEIQRQPELFAALRPLVDRAGRRAKFLILGSASPDVVRGASESLAGRIAFVDMSGFDLSEVSEVSEVGATELARLWQRGGFPRSFLARSEALSNEWRRDFIRTFLERDIPQLGIRIPAEALRRFWTMLAHYHGQIWNAAVLARSLGVNEHTVRRYLDILAGTYVVRVLPPWFEHIGKRQFRAPKLYVRDSGLLHTLLGLDTRAQLQAHPKLGASWEGFALEQVLSQASDADAYFWGTHAGAELDLLLMRGGKRMGIEFKYSSAPSMTKSLHIALADLKLDAAWIVYPGEVEYPVHEQVSALPLPAAMQRLARPLAARGRARVGASAKRSRGRE
jgi:uncharacterized protein